MSKVLIIGYGNPDREDDGVAWHVLQGMAHRLGREVRAEAEGAATSPGEEGPTLLFLPQLTPELAEEIAHYDRVCFVDAHTGAYEEDIRLQDIQPAFQASPFTHHLRPETCLLLAATLYGRAPQAAVLSVRGYRFGFSPSLSPRTAALAEEAIERLVAWVQG
jgi:hydrogenase maturation protease